MFPVQKIFLAQFWKINKWLTIDYNFHLKSFSDYYALKTQIESEFVDDSEKNNKALTHYSEKSSKSFLDLPKAEQQSRLKERLKKYCQKVMAVLLNMLV